MEELKIQIKNRQNLEFMNAKFDGVEMEKVIFCIKEINVHFTSICWIKKGIGHLIQRAVKSIGDLKFQF